MIIKPLHDKVLVEPLNETTTKSGIVLATTSEKPSRGKVIAVGKGKRAKDGTIYPLDVKKDDEVLFGKYSGNEIEIDGKKLVIMSETDIFAILN